MSEDFDLIAEIREDQGKGASRRLRREGKVPAIISGAGRPPRALAFEHNKVIRQLENESFYSSILNIKVRDRSQAAIVKDIQRHPSKPQIMHMDFQRIVEDEKIKMNVPIHYLNTDIAAGVKQEGGTVMQLMNDVEVSCLPKDLPEYFEVDVEHLGLNEMLHLSDIKVTEGVEIPELAQGPEHDHAIVAVQHIKVAPIEEEVEEVEGEEAAEGEEGAEPEGAVEHAQAAHEHDHQRPDHVRRLEEDRERDPELGEPQLVNGTVTELLAHGVADPRLGDMGLDHRDPREVALEGGAGLAGVDPGAGPPARPSEPSYSTRTVTCSVRDTSPTRAPTRGTTVGDE